MSREIHGAPLLRCLLVWLLVDAGVAAVFTAVHSDLGTLPEVPLAITFDRLLVSGCAFALVGCAVWFWLVTTVVVIEAAAGRPAAVRGCPAALRRCVLLACGAALVLAATPAMADEPAGMPPTPAAEARAVLAGLPLPEHPVADGVIVVRPGDSLWRLAAADLANPDANTSDADPADAEIDRRWREIWHANRGLIGDDPDVVMPGMHLHLPIRKDH